MQGTINAIVFGVQGPTSRYLTKKLGSTHWSELKISLLSGMVAGFAQSIVCAPMELVKLQVQNQDIGKVTRYKGNWAVLRDTYKNRKVTGLYRGLVVTAFRDIVGFGVYFSTYDCLMSFVARKRGEEREELSSVFSFINGGCAGICSWIVNFPVDTVKSRYQVDGIDNSPLQYRNARDCFLKTMKIGGVRLLYNGLSAALLRAFANSAFLFPTYEYSKWLLSKQSE